MQLTECISSGQHSQSVDEDGYCNICGFEPNIDEYEVTITNCFDATDPKDAVRQMIEWLQEAGAHSGYVVNRYNHLESEPYESLFIDGDDVWR